MLIRLEEHMNIENTDMSIMQKREMLGNVCSYFAFEYISYKYELQFSLALKINMFTF